MRAQVKSWGTHTLWDSSYQSFIPGIGVMPTAKPVFIDESNADSVYAGIFTRAQRTVTLFVRILNYGNRVALQAQLAAWFKPGTSADLTATFGVDGRDYTLPCVVVTGPVAESELGMGFTIILQSEATSWKSTTTDSDTWNVSGTSGTKAITVDGDDETRLNVTFTPSLNTPNNYKYQRLYTLIPANGIRYGTLPWCITLDTATLVGAGKVQADCDDLRIWIGDKETRRWIANPNNASTKIWFNVDLQTGVQLLNLRTAVTDSETVTWLKFQKTATNRTRMRRLPSEFILAHGGEWFYCSQADLVNYRCRVEERGIYDTTQVAHSVGDDFDFLPAAIRVVYGKAAATAPSLDDDEYDTTKPVFSLSSSDNTSWVWTASDRFYDPDYPDRPGSWKKSIFRLGEESYNFWFTRDAESGNPAIGMRIGSWQKGSTWMNERATVAWNFSDPRRMKTITVTGEKYRSTARWPTGVKGIQRTSDGVTWFTVFTEATPASASTWTALTNDSSAKTIANTTRQVRAMFKGTFAALADAYAVLQMLTCTIAFTDANIPSGSLAAEITNYALDITLTNTTTGESIDVALAMKMGTALVLSGENFTAKYRGANVHQAISLDDEGRSAWIRLVKGTNDLELTGAEDIGTLGLALSWYRRRL